MRSMVKLVGMRPQGGLSRRSVPGEAATSGTLACNSVFDSQPTPHASMSGHHAQRQHAKKAAALTASFQHRVRTWMSMAPLLWCCSDLRSAHSKPQYGHAGGRSAGSADGLMGDCMMTPRVPFGGC